MVYFAYLPLYRMLRVRNDGNEMGKEWRVNPPIDTTIDGIGAFMACVAQTPHTGCVEYDAKMINAAPEKGCQCDDKGNRTTCGKDECKNDKCVTLDEIEMACVDVKGDGDRKTASLMFR